MIYILENEIKQSTWVDDYIDGLVKGLQFIGEPYECTYDVPKPKENQRKDKLIVVHHHDQLLEELRDFRGIKIGHAHATSAIPYFQQVNRRAEQRALSFYLNYLTTTLPITKKIIEKSGIIPDNYGAEVVQTGFPYDLSKLDGYKTKNKKERIAIAGRLDVDKNFYTSAYLLEYYLDKYEIVFYMANPDYDLPYDLSRFEDLGFIFKSIPRRQYLKELAESEIIFTASLADTGNISLVEALYLGCYPVVPRYPDNHCGFNHIVNRGYIPFYPKSIDSLIMCQPEVEVDLHWYNPAYVAKNIRNMR